MRIYNKFIDQEQVNESKKNMTMFDIIKADIKKNEIKNK